MNIHPIIVHFPIALLMVYSIMEIISFVSPKRRAKLYTTKTICLWIGALGSMAAMQSGEAAKHYLGIRSTLVQTHEFRAGGANATYLILAIYYAFKTIISQNIGSQYRSKYLTPHMSSITTVLNSRWTALVTMIASIVGIGLLTIVGALGGALVSGTGHGDPAVDWVVATFVK